MRTKTEHLRDATKMVGVGSFPRPWRVEKNDKNGMRNIVVAANGRLVAEPMPIDGATAEDCEAVAAEIACASSGDAAEMRAALERIRSAMIADSGMGPTTAFHALVDELTQAALAEPARNCNVGTAREQIERFNDFCRAVKSCPNCPLYQNLNNYEKHGFGRNECMSFWGQLPFAPAEGGAE